MSVINQKEYLKKYLGIGKAPGQKKKKKKSKGLSKGLKIVDDNDLPSIEDAIKEDLGNDDEDTPQIVAVIDERPPSLRIDDERQKLWKPIGEPEYDTPSDITHALKLTSGFKLNKPVVKDKLPKHRRQNSPPRKASSTNRDGSSFRKPYSVSRRNRTNSDDDSPPRKIKEEIVSYESEDIEHRNKQDGNIPPKTIKNEPPSPESSPSRRADSDSSPPRRTATDTSPPQRNRRDDDNSPLREKNKNSSLQIRHDNSPPRRTETDTSPLRKRSDEDSSPPRKKRKDNTNSPSRRTDRDSSPPRKERRDIDSSPPRRKNKNSSPQRRQDNSPPWSADTDSSPPRKKRRDSDSSPSRKTDRGSPQKRGDSGPSNRQSDDCSPRRKGSNDSSPPQRNRKDYEDSSPPRRRNKDRDSPPPRKVRKENEDKVVKRHDDRTRPSKSPPRRKTDRKSRWGSEEKEDKMNKTLDGKKSGLQYATELIKEMEKIKRQEDEMFKNISSDISGENAATIVRGKKKDVEEEMRQRQKAKDTKEKYDRWGKGIKQVEDRDDKIASDLHEMNKPLARYADDEDLEKYLKEQEREGDPMLAYIRKKRKTKAVKAGIPEKPMYLGEFMPNRFGIRPGSRWDGVDRSNGYEKKWFEIQNKRKANIEESYKWSTEDM